MRQTNGDMGGLLIPVIASLRVPSPILSSSGGVSAQLAFLLQDVVRMPLLTFYQLASSMQLNVIFMSIFAFVVVFSR